jgi:hypothetical protein
MRQQKGLPNRLVPLIAAVERGFFGVQGITLFRDAVAARNSICALNMGVLSSSYNA